MSQSQTHAERKRFWETHIRDWLDHHQYQTQAAYCAKHGLSESAFTKWKDRLFPKLKRSKHATRKSRFWEKDIKAWHQSNTSQAEYCNLNALSQSAFSKWKKQLHPELGRYKERKPKSSYLKFAKITDEQIDILIRDFLSDTSAQDLAVKANISIKTCYKYLREIRKCLFIGATEYPALFNGAGMLLFLGPPPHIHERLVEKYRGKNKKPSKRELSNIMKESIVDHSRYDWTLAEAWFFYTYGWMFFYRDVYSKIHGFEGEPMTKHHIKFMQAEYTVGQAVSQLWEFYVASDMQAFLTEDTWNAIYYERSEVVSRKHRRNLIHDLKWVLCNHDPLRRNTYWDTYKPEQSEFDSVREKLDRYYALFAENNN